MDNITHALVGLAAGEAVARVRKKDRIPLWIASALGNNIPDIDVVLTSFFLKGKTNYLLHHRGHTHTFLFSPLLALFLFGLLWLFWRKKENFPKPEVFFLCLLGPCLHIFADYWNSYGVHPFWPWDNRWYYGDLVFIVEPWIWALLLPTIFYACKPIGKVISALLMVSILALAWSHAYVPAPIATALTISSALLFLGFRFLPSAGIRVGISLVLLAGFLMFSSSAPKKIRENFPENTTSTLTLTPLPGNPLCFSAIYSRLVEDRYEATVSLFATFPKIYPVEKCPNFYPEKITAPLKQDSSVTFPNAKVLGQFSAPISELETLWQNCRIRAFFRFLRAPFWIRQEGRWLVGDLRYDRDESVGFVEEIFPDSDSGCLNWEPPWIGRFHPDHFLSKETFPKR